MTKLKKWYWKVFFSAYWLATDLGEKKSPEWNATGFLEFITAFNVFGIIYIANFITGGDLPFIKLLLILTMVLSFILNKSIIYSKRAGFTKQINSYEYLSKPKMKSIRNKIILSTLIFTFVFMILAMVINNPTVRSFFNK